MWMGRCIRKKLGNRPCFNPNPSKPGSKTDPLFLVTINYSEPKLLALSPRGTRVPREISKLDWKGVIMDFDEYEYLEKTVENTEPQKAKEDGNGGIDSVKSEERNRSRSSKHKREERADDYENEHRRSKRSKSREESSRDLDRHKERGSRDGEKDRHRSSREHRDKDRDREERNGRDRERERERDRKERDRESERDRDREKERERSTRSQSRSEREQERSRDREFSERESRERDRESRCARAVFRWSFWQLGQALELRSWTIYESLHCKNEVSILEVLTGVVMSCYDFRYPPPLKNELLNYIYSIAEMLVRGIIIKMRNKDKKENAAEAEADPERDQRTVFAYQISLKANERDVYEFFSRAGKVRDVRLIMDRNSRRSKGVGYIEFYDVMSVPMAIALSGQPLLGQPVMVKPSEAEKNLVQSTTLVAAGQTGPYSGGARRLYVGNLHFNITEDQLRQVFEPFGSVELVQLPLDETGHCKGFGFVQFARLEDAKNALNLNGQLEIGGRVIKVSTVTDQGLLEDVGTNAADLDDDEGGGLSLNSSSRALLMAKLDRSGTASSITGSVGVAGNSTGLTATTATVLGAAPAVPSLVPPTLQAHVRTISGLPGVGLQLPSNGIPTIDTIGTPSECLLLKNMFDPDLETEPDFDLDIKEDVQEECSKFGKLKHIYVDRDSAGFVYLRFEDTQAAMSAQRNLHGRWFAAKMITATFMVPQTYEAKFPDSKRLLE
ncbi:RNA recognition motif domain - like 10 [Theobroma cacao]|nr:RNA recognition motif domain - like 10 [Theobroma cacao]